VKNAEFSSGFLWQFSSQGRAQTRFLSRSQIELAASDRRSARRRLRAGGCGPCRHTPGRDPHAPPSSAWRDSKRRGPLDFPGDSQLDRGSDAACLCAPFSFVAARCLGRIFCERIASRQGRLFDTSSARIRFRNAVLSRSLFPSRRVRQPQCAGAPRSRRRTRHGHGEWSSSRVSSRLPRRRFVLVFELPRRIEAV
jgi:hypothetical protein